jgi:hypothetical protein
MARGIEATAAPADLPRKTRRRLYARSGSTFTGVLRPAVTEDVDR